MNSTTRVLLAAGLTLGLMSGAALAQDMSQHDTPAATSEAPEHHESVKQGVKDSAHAVGHATHHAARAVGHAARKTTRAVGHATRHAAHKVKHAVTGEGPKE